MTHIDAECVCLTHFVRSNDFRCILVTLNCIIRFNFERVCQIRSDSFDGLNVKHLFSGDDAEEKEMENDESDGAYYRLKITMLFPPNP